MIWPRLELTFVLIGVFIILLYSSPFQHQLVGASLTPSTNQLDDSNVTKTPDLSLDNNTLPTLPAKLAQNSSRQSSTNSSSLVNDNNTTGIHETPTQKAVSSSVQKQPSNGTQRIGQQKQPPQTQLYPYTLPSVQQQQPFAPLQPPLSNSFPPPSSTQIPLSLLPLSPLSSFSMPGWPSYSLPPQTFIQPEIPPRILSDNNYVSSTGSMHIVGEVINESYKPMNFVKITATFYDANNSVIGTDFTYTDPSTLQPRQRAPFDMIVIEGSMPLYLVAYYTLSVDYSNYDLFR